MNYQKVYNDLVNRGKLRIWPEGEYGEWHHIIPRCLGGDDESGNLVKLTPEEHYVAHQLLVKLNPDNDKLVYAAKMMTLHSNGKRTKNKLYGWLRRAFSKARKGFHHSPEAKFKISLAGKGRVRSQETKRKMSEAQRGNTKNLGKTLSEETRRKISESNIGKKHSIETREHLSAIRKGILKGPLPEETRKKLSLANTGKKRSEECKLKMSMDRRGVSKPVSENARLSARSPETRLKAEATKKRNREFKKMSQLMECLL